MASIRIKIKKGNPYYYIVTSRRTGPEKKPREVILEYIGPLDKLYERVLREYQQRTTNEQVKDPGGSPALVEEGKTSAGNPAGNPNLLFRSYLYGGPMGIYNAAQLLGLEEILDECLPPRIIHGLKRSTILILAIIQRAVHPSSKRAFADWARTTSIPYYIALEAKELTSQDFWKAMDGLSEEELDRVTQRIVSRLVALYPDRIDTLHLDYTNYFTFIDSTNNRCMVCQRGHNKQKRDDLRQFSLALLTTKALNIPLWWSMYDGNVNDPTEFKQVREQIKGTLDILRNQKDDPVTVVFDGGSGGEENPAALPFKVICAVSLSGHKELYDVPDDQYVDISLDSGSVRHAYDIGDIDFYGLKGKGVLYFSQELFDGQARDLLHKCEELQKAIEETNNQLVNPRSRIYTALRKRKEEHERDVAIAEKHNRTLAEELASGEKKRGPRKKPKPVPVWDEEEELNHLLSAQLYKKRKVLASFSSIKIEKDDSGKRKCALILNVTERDAYMKKHYGKKLICTDRNDLTMNQILSEYIDQECIENLFKSSKDTEWFSVTPQFHWTDDKIRVHLFICLMAVTLAEILRIKAEDAGLHYTRERLMTELCRIRDGWIIDISDPNNRTATRTMEYIGDKDRQRLLDLVNSLAGH